MDVFVRIVVDPLGGAYGDIAGGVEGVVLLHDMDILDTEAVARAEDGGGVVGLVDILEDDGDMSRALRGDAIDELQTTLGHEARGCLIEPLLFFVAELGERGVSCCVEFDSWHVVEKFLQRYEIILYFCILIKKYVLRFTYNVYNMLVGFDANNVFRNSEELGEWSRGLVERVASRHVTEFRALLFATRMKADYKGYYSSFANVSTFLPEGNARLMPSAWMRYRLEDYLRFEKVKVFHGLNEEVPYGIGSVVKTMVTCFGLEDHHKTSLVDSITWKKRMEYAWSTCDVVVAVSEEVKRQLLDRGVAEQKIVVIGTSNPYEMTDTIAEQYYEVYERLGS